MSCKSTCCYDCRIGKAKCIMTDNTLGVCKARKNSLLCLNNRKSGEKCPEFRRKTKYVSIAEKAAKSWVKELYRMFIDPGKDAGPKFDRNTFDVAGHLRIMLSMSYGSRKVPVNSMRKALKLGKAEWNKLLKDKNETK